MKKTITFCMCLLAGFAVQAQDDFPLQFVDKDGQIIPDGTALDLMEYEVDEFFGDILMPVKVSVKNVGDATVQGGATYTIVSISNGWFETCFPSNCTRQSIKGTFSTGNAAILPGETRGLQTEWFPDGEGQCEVTYQLQTFRKVGNSYIPDGNGPMIVLCFAYGTTGIGDTKAGKKVGTVTYYDLTGQPTSHPVHGVYMKKTTYADGTADVQKLIFR